MGRVILFLSAFGGVGKTSLIYRVSQNISSMGIKVCDVDLNFRFNHLSNLFNYNDEIDLKKYLYGTYGTFEVLNKVNDYLYYVKTDLNFEYEKHIDLICYHISEIKSKFDYIFVDTNATNDYILNPILSTVDEVFIICTDVEIDIFRTQKIVKKLSKFKNINNVKLILNKVRIVHSIKEKCLNEKDINEILKTDIIFVVKKFYKNNHFLNAENKKFNPKILKNLSYSIITNKRQGYCIQKEYFGIIGWLKKIREYKYE